MNIAAVKSAPRWMWIPASRKVTILFLVILFGQVTAFSCQLLLAKCLRAESFGYYVYTLSWVGFGTIIAKFGLDQATLRFLPAYITAGEWGRANAFSRWSLKLALLISLVFAAGAAGLILVLRHQMAPEFRFTALISCCLLPIAVLLTIGSAGLQARHLAVASRLPEIIFRPLLVMAGVLLAYLLLPAALDARVVMGIHFLAVFTLVVYVLTSYFFAVPDEVRGAIPTYEARVWTGTTATFAWVAGIPLIASQLDILILGILSNPTDAAIYATARRIAAVTAIGLTVANTLLAAKFSECYARGDDDALQQLLRSAAKLLLGLTIPIGAVIFFVGGFALGLFGDEFVHAYPALAILAFSQIVNALCGSVGLLLSMTGHEKFAAVTAFCVCIVNFGLNWLLIPSLGMVGAAVAFAVCIIMQNVVLVVYIRRRLGLHPTVFSLLSH